MEPSAISASSRLFTGLRARLLALVSVRRLLPPLAVILTFAALTLGVTYPVIAELDSSLAQNLHWSRDAYQSAYEMWWFKKALLDLHESPGYLRWIHFPDGADYPVILTYFTTYVVGVPFLLFLSPVAAYNAVFLLTFFLSGLTAYALCAYLTRNRWAGLLGGIVYAFFPNRMAHALAGHLELIATYLFPLYLLLLIKTVRQPRPVTALLCGLTLAASLLVQPLFIPFLLVLFTATWLLCEFFLLQQKPSHRALLALAGAFSLAVLIAAPFFLPVLRQQATGQGAHLTAGGFVSFSADLLGIIAPSPVNPVLEALGIVPAFARRVAPPDWRIAEVLTYAGLVPLGLGTLAVVSQRRRVAAWGLVALTAAVLSLGPVLKVNGELVSLTIDDTEDVVETSVALPYALLANLPLLSLNRAPARINTTLMLALAVLSSYGLSWLMARLRYGWKHGVALALCAFALLELLVIWPYPTMPVQTPTYLSDIARSTNEGAVLNIPITAGHVKQLAIFHQTIHEHPVFDSWFQRSLPAFPNVADFLDGLLCPQTDHDIVPPPAPGQRAAIARAEGAGYVLLHMPYVGDDAAKMRLLETEFGPPKSTDEAIAIYEVTPGPTTVDGLVYGLSNERWHYAETWDGRPARWMPHSARLYIYSPRQQEGALRFTALPFTTPQRLEVKVNQDELDALVIGEWITYTTPAFALQPGINQIAFKALDGCTDFEGDPRCSGVALAIAQDGKSECSHYIEQTRCLSVLFQDIHFVVTGTAPASHPVDASLGEQVRLLGYDLSGTAAPGGQLSLTLYWQALRRPQGDYTVFVHLLSSAGDLAVQHDAPPLGGVYPTSKWTRDDIFTHQVDLGLPPDLQPGAYELLAGMYTYPNIVRLPVASDRPYAQDGLIWLQSMEIGPR